LGELYRVAADCLDVKMTGGGGGSTGPSSRRRGPGDDGDVDHPDVDDDADDDDDGGVEGGGGIDYGSIVSSLRDGTFGLHSDRPLLGLWRFSTRQRKQRAFFRNAARHSDGQFGEANATSDVVSSMSSQQSEDGGNFDRYDWSRLFEDPSRPLVVDVGCGMGVSLLGLATGPRDDTDDRLRRAADIRIDWGGCNFIGVDLSRLAVGYAQSVRSRRGLGGRLTFVVDSAEDCLARIGDSYPGRVALVMLQFPTPYRFRGNNRDEEEDDGTSDDAVVGGFNAQLPEGAASDDFMVTENLLSRIHGILSENDNGRLLIQSNCEDVAVHMRNVATVKAGFRPVDVSRPVASLDAATQRARRWADAGGERAVGRFWSARPLIPSCGRTETEVACLLDVKPVHRCLLEASS
jgi:SAM-dependent methyltransferase